MTAPRIWSGALATCALLVVTACTTTQIQSSPSGSSGASGAAPGAALPAGDPAAFGTYCELGGSPPQVFASNSDKCALGLCVFDGRRDLTSADGSAYHEAYCSADCAKVSCPEAWECVESASAGPKVCVKQVAVCGDGTKQTDETCDDGNRYDRDGCRKDCKKVGGPQLAVDQLLLDGRAYDAYYDKVPAKGTEGEYATFADITSDSFRAHFAVPGSVPYAEFDVVVPRVVGVVDTSSGSPFKVKNLGGIPEPQAGPPKMEVLEAGTDGRSYRVKFTLDMVRTPTCTFVATLP